MQFIDSPVQLRVVESQKQTGVLQANVQVARQRNAGTEKEMWQSFNVEKQIPSLVTGAEADLGFISEGGRIIQSTLKKSEE